jgi:hypothetical protein
MFYKLRFLCSRAGCFALLALLVFAGCKNAAPKKDDAEAADIPSPLQISALLKQAGAKYSGGILLNPANSGKYATNFSKSLVVGIYGTDLAYSNMFGQTQQGISYMEAIMKVSDGLGLSSMLSSSKMLSRFQQNMGNQDSLFAIVSELYRDTDESLKENHQNSSASLILAGGWIEGLYIATRLARTNPNKNLNDRIAELKFSLNGLLASLEDLKQNAEYTPLINSLEDINKTYESVSLTYTSKAPATNEEAKVTTINSSSKVQLSEAQLKELTEQIGNLRTSIVKTN